MEEQELIPMKVKGESLFSIIYGGLSVGVIIVVLLIFSIISDTLNGTIICLSILGLIGIWLKRIIRWVHFTNDNIKVKYLYGNERIIEYNDVKKLYKNQEGFLPAFVYVIKFSKKNGSKLGKVTFHKKELDIENFKKEILKLKNSV